MIPGFLELVPLGIALLRAYMRGNMLGDACEPSLRLFNWGFHIQAMGEIPGKFAFHEDNKEYGGILDELRNCCFRQSCNKFVVTTSLGVTRFNLFLVALSDSCNSFESSFIVGHEVTLGATSIILGVLQSSIRK